MKNNLINEEKTNMKPVLIFSGIILLIMFVISGWAWTQVPDNAQIPVHWGINGEPDRYGSKFEGLLLLPLISAGVVALLAFIPGIDPRRPNIARSQKAYTATWGAIMVFMLMIHVMAILSVMGRDINSTAVIAVGLGSLFMVTGNYLGKIRSNYMFGIRTPWTIDSELAWNKTHRLGGKLFMLLGVFTVLGSIIDQGGWLISTLIGGVLVVTVVLFVYSYIVWKQDRTMQMG